MTFRTRTVEKRGRRRSRSLRSDARRNLYLNVAFAFGIVAAVCILGGVLFAGWYGDHWAPMLKVNGRSFSMDDVTSRAGVIKALQAEMDQRYLDLRNAGKISENDYSTFTNHSGQATPTSQAISELTAETVAQQYADQNGIKVDDKAYNDELNKEATIAEMRHVKVIAARPDPGPNGSASAAAIADAQTRIQKYLDEIKGGKAWDDVSKEADGGYVTPASGDLGTNTKDGFAGIDPTLLDAVFGLAKANDITPIMQGRDGIFRFATVAAIYPPDKSTSWESGLASKGANIDAYHSRVRANALQQLLQNQFNTKNIDSETKQRHVQEIYFSSRLNQSGGTEVKALVALFAPDHNTTLGSTLSADDPKWAEAKARAEDFYNQVKASPDKFRDLTKAKSDDKYFGPDGGEIPWLSQDTLGASGLNWTNLATELFKEHKAGDLVAPVKDANGYLVAEYVAQRPGPNQREIAAELQLNSGTDFATVAKQVSDSSDSLNGGDMGWVAQYQLTKEQTDAIFAAKLNQFFLFTPSDGSGMYIYKVTEEATRKPDADQAARIKIVGFNTWLGNLAGKATVTQDPKLQTIVTNEQNAQSQQ